MKLCFELVTQSTTKEAIETSKSKICVNDLNFFDFTMLLNLFEFHLFNFSACFIQKLDSTTRNYQAKNVLIALVKCLRDSTYTWFKKQLDFNSLNNFKQALIAIFSSSQTFSIDFSKFFSHSSSQYHICLECNAQFSSISRLLTHTQRVNCFKLVCKHCEKDFNSNNKLHKHVRLKHVRKFVNSLKAQRASLKASQSSILVFKTWQTLTFETSSTSLFTFSIVFRKLVETLRHRLKKKRSKHVKLSLTLLKSTILTTSITSRLSRLFKFIQLSITSFVNSFTSKASFKASQSSILFSKTWQTSTFDIFSISFFTFSHMSSLSHYKLSIQKVNHVTKRLFFKLYMIIDDLYIMFHEKSFKKSVNIIQMRVFSSMFDQINIIDYFKFVKQSRICISINQRSRSSQAQDLKQSSNTSNRTSLQSITLFLTLRVNQSIKRFNVRA